MELLGILGLLGIMAYGWKMATAGRLTTRGLFLGALVVLVAVAGSGLADDTLTTAVVAGGAGAKLMGLALMGAKTLLKTVGAGTLIKFIMSFKCFGYTDELIHYVPEKLRSVAAMGLALVIFAVYVCFSSSYAGPGGDAQLSADVAGVLGAGSSANMVHDTLATWFPPKATA